MAKQLVLLLCTFLALGSASIRPRDLEDEAEEQLQQLFSLVQGEILVANNTLTDLQSDAVANGDQVYETTVINIQQEYETIESQLNTIVDLAISAGYDVSRCISIREEVLDRLPDEYDKEVHDCIFWINLELPHLISSSVYLIDVTITKVHDLQNQLRSCRGDILCISSLVTQIQTAKVSLVQDIEREVESAADQVAELKLSVDVCSETNTADFVAKANAILRDITVCVDEIVG